MPARSTYSLLTLTTLACLAAMGTRPAHAALADEIAVGTGYAADNICTRTMVSSDDLWRVKWLYAAPDLSALPLIWKVEQEAGVGTTVSTIVPGLENKRQAVFRPGLGCTVIPPGTTAQSVLAQAFQPHVSPPPSNQPWPAGEGAAQTALLNAGQLAVVKKQGDALFAETTLALNKRQNTYAYLVAKNSQLVFERYQSGYDKDQPQHAWSMTKTLMTLITGLMVKDGRLALDDAPPVAELAEGGKSAITWRHLLQMRSGLQWTENFGGYGPNSVMLWLQPSHGAYAAVQPLEYAPGTHFKYASANTNIVSLGLRNKLAGSSQALYDYYQQRLFDPLGIRGGVIQQDASGTPSGGTRGVLRPRDWLRLGQLILNKGRWNGASIVNADYVDFMTTPSPANPGYGAGVWLYGELGMPADMPRDIVVLWGVKGQYVMLVPSKQLAVLRMGVSFDETETVQRMFGVVRELSNAL